MLIASLLKFTNGRVDTIDSAPEVFFNGGTPTGSLGSLVVTTDIPATFVAGLGYDAAGALCYAPAGAIETRVAGLAVEAAGRLLTSTSNPIDHYVAGLPLTADGRLCINAPAPPLNLSAFSQGFSDAEFF